MGYFSDKLKENKDEFIAFNFTTSDLGCHYICKGAVVL